MGSEFIDDSLSLLSAKIREREISAVEVAHAFISQIEKYNPSINAIVSFCPERALMEARGADQRLAKGEWDGPLHGVPMAFKDTHDVAGLPTTKGSMILRDNVADKDELLVERLRNAGAITLGKTNVPEFAAGSHTFNEVFGVTRNPYNLDRSAGGSSGGAGAALAMSMVPLADGSDMGGSLRNPAAFNNVVGLRPTPGRVPSYPKENAFTRLSVQGPMARTVADTAYMMSVIAGPDNRDPLSIKEGGHIFARSLQREFKDVRVAYSPDLGGQVPVDPMVREAFLKQIPILNEAGFVVEENFPDIRDADEVFNVMRAHDMEAAAGEFVEEHQDRIKSTFVENVELGRKLSGTDIGRAARLQTEIFSRMHEFFEQYDYLVLPVSQVSPFDVEIEYPTRINGVKMDSYISWMRSCSMISVTGHPAISVPGGFTNDGLPFGLQIVGPHGGDFEVLQAAYAFEQATSLRK
ncbi:amidase [Geomicrobium halophilum]|uniref:Amidase n=1 Tax=Geomicrobium halophilum TaxID=549000 RepID=A0A841PPT7_9BACL|nr:amidase [Geomicrobium halophilum]MBB6450780.1 amidase [Geomicrobium halophilum]